MNRSTDTKNVNSHGGAGGQERREHMKTGEGINLRVVISTIHEKAGAAELTPTRSISEISEPLCLHVPNFTM